MNSTNYSTQSTSTIIKDEEYEIRSLLDTDLYKLSMSAVIYKIYPLVNVRYRFKNRSPWMKFNEEAIIWLRSQIKHLGELQITSEELCFLREKCKFLGEEYICFLSGFKLRPDEQVFLEFDCHSGGLSLCVCGRWVDTVLYEIPLLALISAAYFKFVDKDWSYDGQRELACAKATKLIEAGCIFSEFGTRRRRDYRAQEIVLQGLMDAPNGLGRLVGTSNAHFARLFGLMPIGTIAHEFFMGTAAITGDYLGANTIALRNWRNFYGDELSIALTDTFSTDVFLRGLTKKEAELWGGLRQDSGDPREFIRKVVDRYRELGVYFGNKVLVFSDSLNVSRCIELQREAKRAGVKCSFGIGTFLTNDFKSKSTERKSPPMNIVIKLDEASGVSCVKISDEMDKNTGNNDEVERVKHLLGIKGL